jgi:8-oxo-dGTP pyrophosphatase MutT (NUDIX family)
VTRSGPRRPGRPRSPAREELQHSAGGIVVRDGEVLLISTAGGRRWQLPKGHLEGEESPADAAVREVREETGVSGRVVQPISGIDYSFIERGMKRIRKHVDYFLLAYESGSEADFDPSEVVAARWYPWSEAIALLSHDNERRVAEEAFRLAQELTARSPGGSA